LGFLEACIGELKLNTPYFNPHWLKMGHSIDLSRRQDRIPIGQDKKHFNGTIRGIKRVHLLSEENHWIQPQNANLAKRIFKWLKETL
jgi:hypothetical protein